MTDELRSSEQRSGDFWKKVCKSEEFDPIQWDWIHDRLIDLESEPAKLAWYCRLCFWFQRLVRWR